MPLIISSTNVTDFGELGFIWRGFCFEIFIIIPLQLYWVNNLELLFGFRSSFAG
jgi:hypothetical protein